MTEQEMKIFCQLERLQPQRQAKHNSMRQTALNSSWNSFRCHIWTFQSDQEEERRYIRHQAIFKVKFKAGCADFKTNTRSIFSQCSFKVQLLKMEMSLHRTESHQQSTSKSWRERLLHKGGCLNVHAEKTECYDQQAIQRLSKDKQKAQKQEGCVG